jgi:DNA-binding GntR family transcriptional regulator
MRFSELNRQFHTTICHHSDDPHLSAMLDTEWARLDLIRRSAFTHAPGRAIQSVAEHDELLDLIEGRADAETIEAFAKQHKLNTLDAVSRHEASLGASVA